MNKITKNFFHLNILLITCCILCLICYDFIGGLWLKGITSSWFVLLGAVNLIYAKKMALKMSHFLLLMQLSLFLGLCGDVLLGIQFIAGVFAFGLGHAFYLIAFYTLEKFCIKDIFISICIACISVFIIVGTPFIQVENPFLEKILLVYAVIISCMLGKAISNVFTGKTLYRRLILLGSILFWFSDVILVFEIFGTNNRITWILCSYTYWPAQVILAFSIFHYIKEQCQEI